MAEEEVTGTEQAQAPQQQFVMQRVYLRDLSFESPAAPEVFRQEWKPKMNVDLNTKSNLVSGNDYEVVLTITVTATVDEKTAFLIEVHQAGIFLIQGIEGDDLRRILATVCPNMLFPYVRETIDSIAVKGTFPALMLAPVNFDALFQQAVQQAQAKAAEAGGEESESKH
ncbi:protein-export chaperone SecB [Halieaceae bacterium IMCC14734]|uniref:Protein-export protein SecB n=1 Tax=Candidatus Litorirhabdus singularis TaxID=2518993 RepID=A0ABT3TEH7_9GAMM|nr:protein-export chaperone SecB [Candidatus Litorirhabdus singularis]MCX2979832.1 protein-export chaperone SecB [Candidatus Litorirhabdus singularis]